MKHLPLVSVSAALVILSSGCASSDPSPVTAAADPAYCASFADAKTAFQDMASGQVTDFGAAFAVFHDLAAQSPSAISAEWATLDGAFVTVERALDEVGMSPDQLDAVVTRGEVPEGVDVFEMQRLTGQLEQLGSADFAEAASAIEQHGRAACGVDLTS